MTPISLQRLIVFAKQAAFRISGGCLGVVFGILLGAKCGFSQGLIEIPLQIGVPTFASNAIWPVTTGIPLPDGLVSDANQLALFENGERIAAQIVPRATWRPGGDLKWVGLDFLARYGDNIAREYHLELVQSPAPSPQTRLTFTQSDNEIEVDTGVVKFRVNRRAFAGIEEAWYDADGDGTYSSKELVINGVGGPFLVNEAGEVFTSSNDQTDGIVTNDRGVVVEESGPVRITIRAVGWYANAEGNRLCKFVTRISAFADQPFIRVSHRTLITYDTNSATRLRDVAWQVVPNYPKGIVRLGTDNGVFEIDSVPKNRASLFIHQDRSDHYRVAADYGEVFGEGTHASGWLALHPDDSKRPGVTLGVRDFYRKYPKEIEMSSDPDAPGVGGKEKFKLRLFAHFWPKHGQSSGTGTTDETSRNNIYKLLFAHRGDSLNLQIPSAYRDAVVTYLTEELGNPDSDGEVTGMNQANGQGLAIGNEFLLLFDSPDSTGEDVNRQFGLFEDDPHAISLPSWNAATKVLGPIAPADSSFDFNAERALELAYPGYLRGIVESGDEFGMWIYGDTHNNWDPENGRPLIHRVWQAAHYQQAWTAWMLYFRSGRSSDLRWARVNSEHFMDVGTNNFDDGTSLHGYKGYMYHVKGFVPWGGESGYHQHYINPSAYLLRYYLTGDRRAWDLFQNWFEQVKSQGIRRPNPAPPGGFTCEQVTNTSLREIVVAIGELIEYYQATWDPEAFSLVSKLAESMLEYPFECTVSAADHPIWGRRWFSQYFALTGDFRIVQRLKNWADSGFDDLAVAAFLYEASGDTSYLNRLIPVFFDESRIYYDDDGDRYHGYGQWVTAFSARWLQEAPYFLQALRDAGYASVQRGDRRVVYPSMSTSFRPYDPATGTPLAAPGRPSRGWTDSSTVVLSQLPPSTNYQITLDWLESHGDASEQLFVLSPPSPPIGLAANELLSTEQLAAGEVRRTIHPPLNIDFATSNNPGLHRIETVGQLSRIFAPYTETPEAAVLRRFRYRNGCEQQAVFSGISRQLFYIRPFQPKGDIVLRLTGANGKDSVNPSTAQPAYFRLEDETGKVVSEGRVFRYGRKRFQVVTLPVPSAAIAGITASPTWRLYSTTNYGPFFELLDGAEELLLSTNMTDLDSIESILLKPDTTPLCPQPMPPTPP